MIEHLKNVHDKLYLPSVAVPLERDYDIVPIEEPYLYASPSIISGEIDEPQGTIAIPVCNVGGGMLRIKGIEIDEQAKSWLKRKPKNLPAELSASAGYHPVELTLQQKKLLDIPEPHTAHLEITSNGISDTFSAVALEVNLPSGDASGLTVPERVSFGEITVWQLSITDVRGEKAEIQDFYLAGDFDGKPPTRFSLRQTSKMTLHACLSSKDSELHYDLDLSSPGIIAPKTKKDKKAKLEYALTKFTLSNLGKNIADGEAETSADWFSPLAYRLEPASTRTLVLFANVERMQLGRNFGWLKIGGKRISVWAWVAVKDTIGGKENLTLVEESELNYEAEFPGYIMEELPVAASPREIDYDNLPLFEDVEFNVSLSPPLFDGNRCYLVGDFNNWKSTAVMMAKGEAAFSSTLSLPDGTYRYRYELDGEMRLEPGRLNEVIFGAHGFASRISLKRYERTFIIHNNGQDNIDLLAHSSTEWLNVSPTSLSVPREEKVEIMVELSPGQMEPGLNLGRVDLIAASEPNKMGSIPVSAMMVTKDVVPILEQTEVELPNFTKGEKVVAPLKIKLVGAGRLTHTIPNAMLQMPADKMTLHNDEPYLPRVYALEVNIHSAKMARGHSKQVKTFLITDCYLANRRVFGLTYRYQMAHLVTEPRRVYFPRVFLFDKRQRATLQIKRSDGAPIAPGVRIPAELRKNGLLSVVALSDKSYEFILDPKCVSSPGVLSGFIDIRDEDLKINEPVRFAANIIAAGAEINVETTKTMSNPKHEGLNLAITNRGDEELKIFSLQFEQQHFICVPRIRRNTILPPGETIRSAIKIRRRAKLLFKTAISDTLSIHLNDSKYRGGVFKRELEVTCPPRIFGLLRNHRRQ